MAREPHPESGSPKTGRPPQKRRLLRRLNTPLLVGTLVFLAIFVPGVYFWHWYQVRQTAGGFLERADALSEEGNWREAAASLDSYLRLHPDDVEAKIRLAETYDRAAINFSQKSRAAELYYQAIAVAPADRQAELRHRLGELLLETQQFASAEEQADTLLKDLPKDKPDPQAVRIRALALVGQHEGGSLRSAVKDDKTVGAILEDAVRLSPADIELATTLARTYRTSPQLLGQDKQKLSEKERGALADQAIDNMVLANRQNAEAYLARHRYRIENALLPSGKDKADLDEALKLAPEDLEVLLASADQARREAAERARKSAAADDAVKQHLAKARGYFEHAVRVGPADERGYLGLGQIQAMEGKPEEAVKTWKLGLEASPSRQIVARIAMNSLLVEGLLAGRQVEEAEKALQTLDDTIGRLRSRGVAVAAVNLMSASADVLRARLLMAKRETNNAAPLLKRVVATSPSSPQGLAQAYQAQMLLGDIYAASGAWELAASVFEEAAAMQPKVARPHLAAAQAWSRADRPEAAVTHYQAAAELEPTAENWFLLAAARLRVSASLAQGSQDRAGFGEAMAKAREAHKERPMADAWRLELLEAEERLTQSRQPAQRQKALEEAVKLLRAAEAQGPDSEALLAQLATAYERAGAGAEADRVLAKLRKSAGDKSSVPYLLSASVLSARREFEQARAALREGMGRLPAGAQRPLQLALVQVSLEEGQAERAFDELQKLVAESPKDSALLRQCIELALDIGKLKEAEGLEERLKAVEGQEGRFWRYFRARRLVDQAAKSDDPRLTEAESLQADLARLEPAWPSTHFLNGLILERRGKNAQATDAYEEAIRRGDRRLAVYERVIPLLAQLGKSQQAERYLARLQDRASASARLSSLEISSAVQVGQLDRALELARQGAQRRPKDPNAQVWLGLVLVASGQAEQAEAAFRRAVELAPGDLRANAVLVDLYTRGKKLDQARQALEQLAKNVKLPDWERALLLAQGYAGIGDRDKAEAQYREAQRLAPNEAATQERLAAALVRTSPKEAEEALRRALKADPKSATARRALAAILAERGGEDAWQEAVELLGSADEQAQLDQRLRALILARRGGKQNLSSARRIVEKLIAASQGPATADRLLLAQLAEAEGDRAAAQKEYQSVVTAKDPSPFHLAAYVQFLLRHNELPEAGKWIGELEQRMPGDLGAVFLRARWLVAGGKTKEIEPLVEAAAAKLLAKPEKGPERTPQQEADLCSRVGDLYLAVEQYAAAERWHRKAHALDANRYSRLAAALAGQGKVGEAIKLCAEAVRSDKTPQLAMTVAALLLGGKPSEEDFRLADPVLAKAAADFKDDASLLLSLANVRIKRNQVKEACDLLRQVVKKEPANVIALNNLAALLGEQSGSEPEALQYIDRAIQIVGEQPGLLDTKGTILIAQGKAKEAVPLLEASVLAPGADPRYHFHLAVAYHRIGEAGRAREQLLLALKGDLTRQLLTDADLKHLEELKQKLLPTTPSQQKDRGT